MKGHIMLSPLSTYERHGWYSPELIYFLLLLSQEAVNSGWKITLRPAHGFNPAAFARNKIGKLFIESGLDWLIMIDNDMRPPMNLLEMLDNAPNDAAILVPVMHMWENKKGQVVLVWRPVGMGKNRIMDMRESPNYVELEASGSGIIAIKKGVFEALKYPWFRYEYDEDWQLIASEDVPFVQAARKAGFKTYGYTKAVAGHFHVVDLSAIPPREEPLDETII